MVSGREKLPIRASHDGQGDRQAITRHLTRVAGAAAIASGIAGIAAAGALATGSAGPVSNYPIPLGKHGLPSSGKGVSVVGACPGFLFSDPTELLFTVGNAVSYGPTPNPGTYGGNVEGNAELVDGTTGDSTGYAGHAHAWLGQNTNPTGNGQSVRAETVDFHGTDPAGDSITIQASVGETNTASGNMNGWEQVKITCS